MLKRFLTFKPTITTLSKDTDRKKFFWTNRKSSFSSLNLTVSALIKEKTYLISDFYSECKETLLLTLDSIEQALDLSLQVYGPDTLSVTEVSRLYKICKNNNLSFTKVVHLNVPHKLKGFPELVQKLPQWDEIFLQYLDAKSIPWKTLCLMTLMKDNQIKYIIDFTKQKNPSVQSFRQFVETVRDFSDKINSDSYNEEEHGKLTNRITPSHALIKKSFEDLKRSAPELTISNNDNFESNLINWSFSTNSSEDFKKAVQMLSSIENNVEDFYKILYRILK